MATSIGYFLWVISLCIGVMIVNPISCYAEYYFFIFGDSLYDPGNYFLLDPVNGSSGYCPYGMTHFHHPTGRFSDGRVSPDFIAHRLGLPFIPPYQNQSANFTHGASFASGGSGVLDIHPFPSINIRGQYANFTNLIANWSQILGPEEASKRLKEAVYLISMGGNDYFVFSNNTNASFRELQANVSHVIGNLSDVIKEMYKQGARKFMFQTVSPIGCLPMIKEENSISGNGCAEIPMTLASLHNDALYKMADSIQNTTEFSEFIYSIFDFFTALRLRIRDPARYGFKIGDSPCSRESSATGTTIDCNDVQPPDQNPHPKNACTNPSEYVFFDGGHNTDAANRQFADLLWGGGPEVYPHTMEELFLLNLTPLSAL